MQNDRMSAEEYRRMIDPKSSKYGNKRVAIDGISFDSQLEANRYCELKILLRSGEIDGFGLQPSFRMKNGHRYRADFIVSANGKTWMEDTKGYLTASGKLKIDQFRTEYPYLELRVIDKNGEII